MKIVGYFDWVYFVGGQKISNLRGTIKVNDKALGHFFVLTGSTIRPIRHKNPMKHKNIGLAQKCSLIS